MPKKSTFMFFLIILLFLVIGAASANDNNSTDALQETQDDTPITSVDLNENDSNDDEKTLKSTNDKTDELKSDSSSNIIKSASTPTNNNVAKSTTKTKLKITTYANFVKKGGKYYMYLVDSNGNPVVKKKVKVTLNGKTYKKTTGNYGKFAVKIKSKKSSVTLKIKSSTNSKYYGLSKKIRVYIQNSFKIKIGNSKLLTNGYLQKRPFPKKPLIYGLERINSPKKPTQRDSLSSSLKLPPKTIRSLSSLESINVRKMWCALKVTFSILYSIQFRP